jgi:hypothetical protein
MTSIRRSWRAASELGLPALTSYAGYRLGLATGWFRLLTPEGGWDAWPLGRLLEPGVPDEPRAYAKFRTRRGRPLFLLETSPAKDRHRSVTARRAAEAILRGRFPFGGGQEIELGFPPKDWAAVPGGVGVPIRADLHWTRYDLGRLGLDARLAWEASRLGWVFPLARAFYDTGDRRYAEGFWTLWESWRSGNPPNRGLQWASAQEVALRLLALVVAFYVLVPAWGKRPERAAQLAQAILLHARRIPPTVSYARAQGNNHLLSEAAGLYTAGMLFPEARGSSEWRRRGRALFLEGVRRQVFADGGYVQHSANYHRLAIQLGLWVARLAQVNDEPFPPAAVDSLGWSTLALAALVDPETGQAARFGPDDGSNLLPLGGSAGDFRPTLQAATRLFLQRPLYGPGPWDESGDWLGLASRGEANSRGRRAKQAAPEVPVALPIAGLYRLAGADTWGLLRAAHFTSRPGHSDQLHVDLWWRGVNIALDPGSYLYRAPTTWDGGLAEAALHNGVTMDGSDPMERAGPFLWLGWSQARLLGRWASLDSAIEILTAEQDIPGGVVHRRTLARAGDAHWLVVDDWVGQGTPRLTLGWNIPDGPWRIAGRFLRTRMAPGPVSLAVEGGDLAVYRGGELVGGTAAAQARHAWGWYAPGYGRLDRCLRVVVTRQGGLPARFISRWSLGGGGPPVVVAGLRPPGAGTCPVKGIRVGRSDLRVEEA